MLDIQHCTGSGADGAPISPDVWRRAVYRSPPACFGIEMLSPTKQGGGFSFGMRICPIKEDSGSLSSNGSHNAEYVIWRRWEDCLAFQETLSLEYKRMARAKRQRLVAGKGVKKNGLYVIEHAASFESLPPGPDPNSVGLSIHDYLPKLTKKATIFRASQTTIDQRQKELSALVQSLWKEDVPALIRELRETRTIVDFFAYWRMDYDLAEKEKRRASKSSTRKPRSSVTSSVFSTYFSNTSSSTSEFSDQPRSPTLRGIDLSDQLPRPRPHTSHSSEKALPFPRQPLSAPPAYRARIPSRPRTADPDNYTRRQLREMPMSSSFDSPPYSVSSHRTTDSLQSAPIMLSQDIPIVFSQEPEHFSDDRPLSSLVSLPEDQELKTPLAGMRFTLDEEDNLPPPVRRTRRNSYTEVLVNEDAQDFPLRSAQDVDRAEAFDGSRSDNRCSWQSTVSSATVVLEGLDIALPKDPLDGSNRSRQSICSIASVVTTNSADAIIPRSPTQIVERLGRRRSLSASAGSRTPINDGQWSDHEDDMDLYAAKRDMGLSSSPGSVESESRPQTPVGFFALQPVHIGPVPRHRSPKRPSTAQSSSSSSSSGSSIDSLSPVHPGNTIAIKAAHNKAIIVFRAPREISYNEMRRKLYEKFVRQEGVPLSESFKMVYMLPPTIIQPDHVDPARARSRSESFSSMWSTGVSDLSPMRSVTSQVEWEMILASVKGGKLTIRILDSQ